MNADRRAELRALVEAEMAGLPVQVHDATTGHPLCVVGFGADEVIAATEAMIATEVTMGARVRAFEAAWAARCGCAHGVMVNSGSSANLVLLAALVETGRLAPGDEVLVPAVTWSTTLFPVAQAGLVPVLVDVDPETLCLSPARASQARTARTRAVFAVHLLGQAAALDGYDDLLVLEDACGAHGARVGGREVGGLGLAGTFSFFFSHHLTTVEGGMIVTNDAELADAMRSIRAHGWVRERSDRAALVARTPEIDPRFLFVSAGYNLRPTEMAAAFGLVQAARLDPWVARRRANHAEWCARLAKIPGVTAFPEAPGTAHAGFAFPILVDGDRASCMAALEAKGIETRPISGSNLARQPAFARVPHARVAEPLPVADAVHTRGFFVGNSHAFGAAHGERLAAALSAWRGR